MQKRVAIGLNFFLFATILIATMIAAGCSDSDPTVTSCSSSSDTATSAVIAASASCGSLDTPATSSVFTSTNGSIPGNTIDPTLYTDGGYYIPIEDQNGNSEQLSPAPPLPTNSAYYTDRPFIYTQDPSLQALDFINEMLCVINQTQHSSMINMGPYRALVDTTQCGFYSNHPSESMYSDQNHWSKTGVPQYQFLTVESIQEGDTSPQMVKAWIHQEANPDTFKPSALIEVLLFITDESLERNSPVHNPYGVSEIYFTAHSEGSDDSIFSGYLRTEEDSLGNSMVEFYNNGMFDIHSEKGSIPVQYDEKGVLVKDSDGTGGKGTLFINNVLGNAKKTVEYDIAYNSTYFLREGNSSEVACLSREDAEVTARRYGLYHNEGTSNPGSRFQLSSGFPIRYSSSQKEYYGWAGFWGIWMAGEPLLSDGATVIKQSDSENEEGERYILKVKNGRMERNVPKTLSLADVIHIPFFYRDMTVNKTYRVKWNGTTFTIFQERDETTLFWKESVEDNLDLNELQTTNLSLWSDSLGGKVIVALDACSNNGNGTFNCSHFTPVGSKVIIFSERTITSTDLSPSELLCVIDCPDPALFSSFDDDGNPFFDTSPFQNIIPSHATFVSYLFDSDTLLLSLYGSDVISSRYTSSGPLFDDTEVHRRALTCDQDDTGNSTCGWQAWSSLDEFYVWKTGYPPSTQLALLKNVNDNTTLTFDQPKQVFYTHTQTDPEKADSKYSGATFYLRYNAFGTLFGIPKKCIDFDAGDDTGCFETEDGTKWTIWINEFTIPDGSVVSDDETFYYVKALEKTERMKPADLSSCVANDLTTTTYPLPDGTLWKEPLLGDEPFITTAPAVVGGVLR